MKHILWISKHKPLPSQIIALQTKFGFDCEVRVDNRMFVGIEDIIGRIQEYQPDEVVLMAPLSVCKKLLAYGIQPLYAEMRQSNHPEVITYRKSGERPGYEFVRFLRLRKIDVVYDEI